VNREGRLIPERLAQACNCDASSKSAGIAARSSCRVLRNKHGRCRRDHSPLTRSKPLPWRLREHQCRFHDISANSPEAVESNCGAARQLVGCTRVRTRRNKAATHFHLLKCTLSKPERSEPAQAPNILQFRYGRTAS
jgi:hypothetical protein